MSVEELISTQIALCKWDYSGFLSPTCPFIYIYIYMMLPAQVLAGSPNISLASVDMTNNSIATIDDGVNIAELTLRKARWEAVLNQLRLSHSTPTQLPKRTMSETQTQQ